MTVQWHGHCTVDVQRAIGTSGCARERWRFSFGHGALLLIGYTRESLPSRKHRRWRNDAQWGGCSVTMTTAQVPMGNALAAEILTEVAQSMAVQHNGLTLPSMGWRLSGVDDPPSTA